MHLEDYIQFRAVDTTHSYEVHPFDLKMTIPSDLHIDLVVKAFKSFLMASGWPDTLVNRIKYDENSI